MPTILEYLIFLAIIGAILTAIFAQVWDDAKEIGAEQQRRKDFREANYWKQKAQHPITHIKVIGGGTEEFILENRR